MHASSRVSFFTSGHFLIKCHGQLLSNQSSVLIMNHFSDKNECEEEDKCTEGKYCINNPGSYRCEGRYM